MSHWIRIKSKLNIHMVLWMFISISWSENNIPFQVMSPEDKSIVLTDSIVLTGSGPKAMTVMSRGYAAQVDSSGNWSLKMPSPQGTGRYSFKVDLLNEGVLQSSLNWRIEKMDADVAYQLDSLTQVQDVQREEYNKGSLGDVVFFMPKTNDISLLSLNAWRNAQILNSKDLRIKYIHPDEVALPKSLKSRRECHEIYCASLLAAYNRIPYAITGKVIKTPKNYKIELMIIRSSDQKIEKVFSQKVVNNKFLALEALDDLGAKVYDYASTILTAQLVTPEDLVSVFEEQKVLKRQREIDAIMGTHIVGTDLPDTLFADRSPYVISNTVIVPAGKTTVIQKGATFLMYGSNTEIQVFGQIRAEGSFQKPIKFISHRVKPVVGDWAGFVIQSPYTSVFNHIQIEHARNGMDVVNSAIEVNHSFFKRNLNFGIHARNSDVYIKDSEFRSGHESAIFAESYSQVRVDRTKFASNQNAITIGEFGQVEVRSSDLYQNDYGVILMDSVSALFANTRIRDNRVGLASTRHFKSLEDAYGAKSFSEADYAGVRANIDNFVHLNRNQIEQLLQQFATPKKVKLLLNEDRKANFKDQLVTTGSEQRDLKVNNMGSVSMELGYHVVEVPTNNSKRIDNVGIAEVEPGAKYLNDKQIEGIHARTSVFTLTEIDDHSLEFNMDLTYDDSVGAFTQPLTLRYTGPNRSIVAGDLNESGHELVLSSRDVLGVKYEEYASKARDGSPKWTFTGLWGESQRPLDVGDHNPLAYFDEILPGNARPQEIITMGKVSHQYTPNLKIDGGIVHSKESREDLLFWRDDLRNESVLGEPQLQAQSIFTEWDYTSPKQLLRLNVAMIHASSDSLDVARDMAIDRFIRANNIIEQADSLRLALKERPSPNPAKVSDYLPAEYPSNAFVVIAKVNEDELAIRDSLSDQTYYGFRKTIQSWGGQTVMELNFGQTNIFAKAQFMGQSFYSAGSPNLNQNSRSYELSWNQGVTAWWESNLSYGAYVENASSKDDQMNLFGYGEGSFLGLVADEASKSILDADRIQPRYLQDLNLAQTFYLPKGIDMDVGYHYQQNFQRTNRVLEKDTTNNGGVFLDDYFAGDDLTLDHFGEGVNVSQDLWNDYLALPDTLATQFLDLWAQNEVSTHLRWKYNRRSSVRLGIIYSWQTDASDFSQAQTGDLELSDSTWAKLGYYYNGENFNQYRIPFTWSANFERINNRLNLQYLAKSFVADQEDVTEYSFRNSTTYDLVPTKWSLTLDLGLRNKRFEKNDIGFFFVDTSLANPEPLRYYTTTFDADSNQVTQLQAEDSRLAADVNEGTVAGENFQLQKENLKFLRQEIDIYCGLNVKYNYNSRLYTEVFARYDEFGRPQDLNEQFTDYFTGARVNYSF